MFYNGILMESIRMYVMVSIGILLFFFSRAFFLRVEYAVLLVFVALKKT